MFRKCFRFAKGAMLLVTLVTLVRFGSEAVVFPSSLTKFISTTVVILVVPLYFGYKAAQGVLSGYGELAGASVLFALWGEITVAIAAVGSGLLQIPTHYLSPQEMMATGAMIKHAAMHVVAGGVLAIYGIIISFIVYALAKRGRAPQTTTS